jgi:hypothetical protein
MLAIHARDTRGPTGSLSQVRTDEPLFPIGGTTNCHLCNGPQLMLRTFIAKICCHLHNLHKSCHVHNRPEQISAQERNFDGDKNGMLANVPAVMKVMSRASFLFHYSQNMTRSTKVQYSVVGSHAYIYVFYTLQFHPCQSGTVANISTE